MASWQTNQIQSLNPSQDFSLWKTQLPAARFHRSLVRARICFKINEWHRWRCKRGFRWSQQITFYSWCYGSSYILCLYVHLGSIIHVHQEWEIPGQRLLYSEHTGWGRQQSSSELTTTGLNTRVNLMPLFDRHDDRGRVKISSFNYIHKETHCFLPDNNEAILTVWSITLVE